MRFARTLAALVLLLPLAAQAQGGWRNQEGAVLPDTSSSKSADGFAASMIITADPDWQKKWETPPDVTPRFELSHDVSAGGELYILAFLSNPQLDAGSMADVTCDLRISRPDGSLSSDEHDLPCFKTQLTADPTHVYLATVGVKFVAEPSDPRGTWTVEINVRDNQRKVTLPLRSTFELH